MNLNSLSDMHWTDEQLIAGLYGVGPKGDHLRTCDSCSSRQALLAENRKAVEAACSNEQGVRDRFFALQRRAICEKLYAGETGASLLGWRRWAPVSLAALLLTGGAAVYQEHHAGQAGRSQLSDAQLALEVSAMSQEWQDQPAAPLQGLFE
jgi:hypothetical protein